MILKIDNRALHIHKQKAYGMMDFATQKAREFLLIQDSLNSLDHNSQQSDHDSKVNIRAEQLIKNIGSDKMFKQMPRSSRDNSPQRGDPRDEVANKRQKMIKNEVPTHMIKFKNKSERERYVRVVKCILSLPMPTDPQSRTPQQLKMTMN